MKKQLRLISCVLLCVATQTVNAQQGEIDKLKWRISNGILTINGIGAIPDYSSDSPCPWYPHKTMISSVVIGDSVTAIGNKAFYACYFNNITIPNSVKSFGSSAFENCDSLTSIIIPESITSISNRLFFGCMSLSSVTIPNSVTSIGDDAFYLCRNLTSITIPNTVTSIGIHAFAWSGLTSITIPTSVKSIGYSAFFDCKFADVTIPYSVTKIDFGAFNNCNINVDKDNPVFTSVDGALYSKDTTKLFVFPCRNIKTYKIPPSVKSFAFRALSDCNILNSVSIPASLTNIGNMAFAYCNGITEINNYATTPQVINKLIFSSINKDKCILRVSAASIKAYRKAEGWSEFKNIEALTE